MHFEYELLPEEKESERNDQLERRERERSGSLDDPDPVFDGDQQRFPFEHFPSINVHKEEL